MDTFDDRCDDFELHEDKIDRARDVLMDDQEVLNLSEVFKVLGDPTRLRVIYVLSKSEMCVCDIAEVLGMSQSAISHQLRLLRNLKLVKYKKEGKSVIYSLDDEHILNLFTQGMEHIRHI